MCQILLECLLVFYSIQTTNSASLPLYPSSALAQVVIPCFLDSCFDLIPSLTPLQAISNLAARMSTPLPPYHLKDKSYSSVAHMKPSIISPAHILPKFPLLLAILPQLPQSNSTLPRILIYLRVLEHPMFLHLF